MTLLHSFNTGGPLNGSNLGIGTAPDDGAGDAVGKVDDDEDAAPGMFWTSGWTEPKWRTLLKISGFRD